MNPIIEERIRTLRCMDHVIRTMQHEMAYETWILMVPDEADDEEFFDIANDEESWGYAQDTFVRLVKLYGRHGW